MTMVCAFSHSSLPAHHSADSAGARPEGGFALARERLNSDKFIAKPSASRLPPSLGGKPPRRLLDYLSEREQRLLVEWTSDELEPERQAVGRQAAWHGNSGQARHVHRHREHVVEVHLDRIGAALLADAEGGRWRRRREDCIHAFGKDLLEVALDQRAYLLCAQVIGVVIAGRKHVGADHDAPAHLLAETARARVLVHVGDVAPGDAQTIAHAVVAREIG